VDEREAIAAARGYFLDDRNLYGCAETTFIVLKEAFGLDEPVDASPAMAFNGGVAYGGAICGAISGAAIAVGMLAERRAASHPEAKRIARGIIADLMDEFAGKHGALDCRTLTGFDLRAPGGHDAFLESDVWRTRCMAQVETAVALLAPLGDETVWRRAVAALPIEQVGPGSGGR
jgi:C_GCAxxG_C_C family probable redox protein